MKLGEIPPARLFEELSGPGIRLKVGPFIIRLRTSVHSFVEAFQYGYTDFSLCEAPEISDFQVRLVPRWPRGAAFYSDGDRVFKRFRVGLAMAFAEWGINFCIYTYAHQFLMIHSAIVEKGGRAIILAGPPGSGKSTLCAALLGKGWRLLSDEFTLLRPDDGGLVPIPRPVALKGTSIGLIRELVPDACIGPIFPGTHKGTITHLRPPTDAVLRQCEIARPGWIAFPKYRPGAETRLVPMSKGQAFARLIDNCFNYEALGQVGFDCLTDAIDAADCYELPLGDCDLAVRAIDSLAEAPPICGGRTGHAA